MCATLRTPQLPSRARHYGRAERWSSRLAYPGTCHPQPPRRIPIPPPSPVRQPSPKIQPVKKVYTWAASNRHLHVALSEQQPKSHMECPAPDKLYPIWFLSGFYVDTHSHIETTWQCLNHREVALPLGIKQLKPGQTSSYQG